MLNDDTHPSYGSIEDAAVNHIQPPRYLCFQRWYIVSIFALFAMGQGAVSNTWGPISNTVNEIFGWNTETIAILSAWNNIIFLIAFMPMVKMMMKYGLRKTTLLCSLAMAVSTGIRCIPAKSLLSLSLAHISAILCGFSNTLGMIGPTAVSVTWFPIHQRTLATAIVSVSNNNFANVASFLLAKEMVHDLPNETLINGSLTPKDEKQYGIMFGEVRAFMLVEFIFCFLIFIGILSYFPRRPEIPPSSSAVMQRVNYREGFIRAVRLKNLWLVLLPYALPLGIQPAFLTVMDPILKPFNIDQVTCNWIGFYTALGSAASGLIFSMIADKLQRSTKVLLIVLITCGGLSYGWFLLMALMPHFATKACIYLSLVLGGVFANGAIPLLYELACEITYPISEEVTTGIMTAFNNLSAVLFLVLVSIDSLGQTWALWCLTISFIISVPSLIFVKAEYNRLEVDDKEDDSEDSANSNATVHENNDDCLPIVV